MTMSSPATKRSRRLRRAGERASTAPPVQEFNDEEGIDKVVPATTVMSAYQYVAEYVYKAGALCYKENKVDY